MGDTLAPDVLGRAEEEFAAALDDVENPTARYHIRQAAQHVEMTRWEEGTGE